MGLGNVGSNPTGSTKGERMYFGITVVIFYKIIYGFSVVRFHPPFLIIKNFNYFKKPTIKNKDMEWYKTLSINQRIGVKECYDLATGLTWEIAISFFGFNMAIELFYSKLKMEGIL